MSKQPYEVGQYVIAAKKSKLLKKNTLFRIKSINSYYKFGKFCSISVVNMDNGYVVEGIPGDAVVILPELHQIYLEGLYRECW